MAHWRDPFLFAHEGYIYHFVCASRNDGLPEARGTVGIARSLDMVNWEILPPLPIEPVAQELECPQARQIGKHFFLIYSSFPEIFAPETRAKYGDLLRHGTYTLVGDSPLGPFTAKQYEPILPVTYPVQPYASQIVKFGEVHYLLGTVWNDEHDFVCEPIQIVAVGDRLMVASNE
jgi:beta-fructofuranosidase